MMKLPLDSLRILDAVARHGGYSAAINDLHLSKGAISYRIKMLEQAIGFDLFERSGNKITLTEKGQQVWQSSQRHLGALQKEIDALKESPKRITIGMTTYFASRWLAPRLMNFTSKHPDISLRVQPTQGLVDPVKDDIDILVRWGNGSWNDLHIQKLFSCPAFVTAGPKITRQVNEQGLRDVVRDTPLLHDDDSSTAWTDWFGKSGYDFPETQSGLVIPDPNVRVEAVKNDQGLALNDTLVTTELTQNLLFRISEIELEDYGYFLAFSPSTLNNSLKEIFQDWIVNEAKTGNSL